MLRKILKGIAWTAVGLIALCILLYAVVLAINWRDREPSATALRFERLFNERPRVPDAENGHIYVLGFNALVGQTPRELGVKRAAWIQESIRQGRWELSKDPETRTTDLRETRDPIISEFIKACGTGSVECPKAMDEADPVLDLWSRSEPWLLGRYRALLAHPSWLEPGPYDVNAPLPAYGLVMDGQRLLLLNARALARKGDSAGVRSLLEEEVRFWRIYMEIGRASCRERV